MKPENARVVADFLVRTIQAEISLTTGVFAAVPAERVEYRPDPVSKSALELLRHITLEDEYFLNGIAAGVFGPMPDQSDACGISTPASAVACYQQRVPVALQKVAALSPEELARELEFMGVIKMPAVAFLSLMMRHSVHHRGQLSAYLRSMGAKVPGIYGPSADVAMATT